MNVMETWWEFKEIELKMCMKLKLGYIQGPFWMKKIDIKSFKDLFT